VAARVCAEGGSQGSCERFDGNMRIPETHTSYIITITHYIIIRIL